MDVDSLTYLLRGGHFNVAERKNRGIWPHPPLEFEKLVEHLARIIALETWFPFVPTPGDITESGLIQRVADDCYVYHAARTLADNPNVVAESSATKFANARDAARHYLKWSLHLPGDLDSWKVV